jgi:hypothetical protein
MNTNITSNTSISDTVKRPRYSEDTSITIKTEIFIKNKIYKRKFDKSKLKLETYDDYLKLGIKDPLCLSMGRLYRRPR